MTDEHRTQASYNNENSGDARSSSKWHTVTVALASAVVGALLCAFVVFVVRNTDFSPSQANSSAQVAAEFRNDTCDTKTTVVASVNQWGSLATQLGGKCVQVTSLINSTNVEPHDYEPTSTDIAQIQNADIVLVNGAGYDEWAVNAADANKQTVVNVADLMNIHVDETEHDHAQEESAEESGHHHHHGSVNPHLWFSPEAILHTEQALEQAMKNKLGESSQSAATVTQHANTWHNAYSRFTTLTNTAKASRISRTVVAAEPVANYLLEYVGARDITPAAFTNATNSEAEPAPADITSTLEQAAVADIVILNPQEMSGYAKQIQEVAQQHHRTIVQVSEQLPEGQTSLLDWISVVAQQLIANDTEHGYFLTQDVADRTLADYAGQWQSVYPYLKDGTLDTVMQSKAKAASKTVQEEQKYYETGYKTDVKAINIQGDSMTFTIDGSSGETTVTAQYEYTGYKILDYAKGNRGVRYLFTAVGDVPQGAPKFVQFSDHGIAAGKAEHFHIFMGGVAGDQHDSSSAAQATSQDELLKEMDNWPTYYPASLSGKEIAKEMLAHS